MVSKFKPRFRYGAIISLEELRDRQKAMELNSDLYGSHGYIGYVDIWNDTGRLYVFDNPDDAATIVKAAKSIGFSIAGLVADVISIRNSDLERPHLRHYRNQYSFIRELYR